MDYSTKTSIELIEELVTLRGQVSELENGKSIALNGNANIDHKLLRTIIDGLPDGIYAKDAQARKTLSNLTDIKRCKTSSEDELLGRTDYDFYPYEIARKYFEDDMTVLQKGIAIINREEYFIDENGKESWLLTSKFPLKNQYEEIIGLVGTGLNYSDHKTSKIKLQKARKELEQFTYVASHDLQEPLRVIKSYMELLEKRYADHLDKKGRKYIKRAVDATSRMKSFIDDLLLMSKVEARSNEFEPVCIQDLMETVIHDLEVLIVENKAKITFSDLPVVNGDPTLLKQLFFNLVNNAIKFNQPGRSPIVNIQATKKSAMIEVAITDNGIGIEAKHIDRIFVIFQRLHCRSEYKGTGIGLSLCKKIVGRHGGEIWIDSTPNIGSTFFFTLPVAYLT